MSKRQKVGSQLSGMKKCPKCGEEKSVSDFGRDASRPDGRYTHCKHCRRNPSRQDREVLELAQKGLKRCTKCLRTKPFCAYEKDITKSLGVSSRCRKCRREALKNTKATVVRPIRKNPRDYTKWEVFEDDNFTCYICEEVLSPDTPHDNPKSLSIDHVVPLSKGGLDERDNVRTACLACNRDKNDMFLDEYLLMIGA